MPDHYHRPDIDGLRAVAIIVVLGFHAAIPYFGGGFVGVDIFFVISGFLITQDIMQRIERGNADLLEFWARRIRRVLPALTVIIIAVFGAALFVLPSDEMIALARMANAAILMRSNIDLANMQGYFSEESRYSPLLHTWSLGVEASFYLVWPAFLIALLTAPRRGLAISAIVAIAVLSFALSAYDVHKDAEAAFYLFRSRAWELAAGGLILFMPVRIWSRSARWAPFAAASGLGLIVAAVLCYSNATRFPGFAAALPCGGALLVIAAGMSRNAISSGLAVRPLTALGRISYSLYLIHWPLLVLASAYWAKGLPLPARVALVLLAIPLAALSWRFVEEPARRYPANRQSLWLWAIVIIACVGSIRCLAFVTMHEAGFPQRGQIPRWQAGVEHEATLFQASPCLVRGGVPMTAPPCFTKAPGVATERTALLWGDSHALQLANAFTDAAQHAHLNSRIMTKAGCPPVPDYSFYPSDAMRKDCRQFNDAVLARIQTDPAIDTIVIAGRWDGYWAGSEFVTDDGRISATATQGNIRQAFSALSRALHRSGKRLIVVGPAPLAYGDPLICVRRMLFNRRDPAPCGATLYGDATQLDRWFLRLLPNDVPTIDLVRIACGGGRCPFPNADHAVMLDNSHFSKAGAAFVEPWLERGLRQTPIRATAAPPDHGSSSEPSP